MHSVVKHIPKEVVIETLIQTIEVQVQGKFSFANLYIPHFNNTSLLGGMTVIGTEDCPN
jgi:hypothetical protein